MSKEDRELRRQERKEKAKIPFKDRAIGKMLSKAAPHILDTVKDLIPDRGLLGIVKNLIIKDKTIPESDKAEIQRELDRELEEYKLYLEDLDSARDMYKSTGHEMADDIATRVIKWNLWVVLLAVVIEITAVLLLDDKVLIAVISGAIGSITTALLQERQQIINFFFGSSRGSKNKDKLINK